MQGKAICEQTAERPSCSGICQVDCDSCVLTGSNPVQLLVQESSAVVPWTSGLQVRCSLVLASRQSLEVVGPSAVRFQVLFPGAGGASGDVLDEGLVDVVAELLGEPDFLDVVPLLVAVDAGLPLTVDVDAAVDVLVLREVVGADGVLLLVVVDAGAALAVGFDVDVGKSWTAVCSSWWPAPTWRSWPTSPCWRSRRNSRLQSTSTSPCWRLQHKCKVAGIDKVSRISKTFFHHLFQTALHHATPVQLKRR